MEKTIKLEITESQAKKFESLLDKTLEILNRWESESPERDRNLDLRYRENLKKLSKSREIQTEADKILAKWQKEMENDSAWKNN
ncbi:MAG: hypothetical protein ACR2J3_05355 [Aridibacter sp.]